LEHVQIDTLHFVGNFPQSCELHATAIDVGEKQEEDWTLILPQTNLGPNRIHYFQLENVHARVYTHVRLTIYPDGGVKRLRIFGRRTETEHQQHHQHANGVRGDGTKTGSSISTPDSEDFTIVTPPSFGAIAIKKPTYIDSVTCTFVPVLPLTPEAFAGFGRVIEAYADANSAPRGVKVTAANEGTARKFHKLALVESSYPPTKTASTGLSVYRCRPLEVGNGNGTYVLNMLERHPYTNQAFIPMSGCKGVEGSSGLEDPGMFYLVVVAKNGVEDKPDLDTLRAFVASGAQGVVYDTAVWRTWSRAHRIFILLIIFRFLDQPMTVLGRVSFCLVFHWTLVILKVVFQPMDFTCVEAQIGNGDGADCEVYELDRRHGEIRLRIPPGLAA
jgi:allantoicase